MGLIGLETDSRCAKCSDAGATAAGLRCRGHVLANGPGLWLQVDRRRPRPALRRTGRAGGPSGAGRWGGQVEQALVRGQHLQQIRFPETPLRLLVPRAAASNVGGPFTRKAQTGPFVCQPHPRFALGRSSERGRGPRIRTLVQAHLVGIWDESSEAPRFAIIPRVIVRSSCLCVLTPSAGCSKNLPVSSHI